MKKRLLSLVLAASMVLGSINVAFADEASVSDDAVIEAADEAVDEVASGDAVEAPAETAADDGIALASAPEGQVGPYDDPDHPGDKKFWDVTSPWQASVYGDCGDDNHMPFLGDPANNPNGVSRDAYEVEEINGSKEVKIRMGYPDGGGSNGGNEGVGKISSGKDGRVVYYQKLTADDDFTLSATAHVNALFMEDNNLSQTSFGLFTSDLMDSFVKNGTAANTDSINAGPIDLDKPGADNNMKEMGFGYTRIGGKKTVLKPSSDDSLDTYTLPAVGDDIKISIKKSGDIYTLKYGNISRTYDAAENGLSIVDDMYVGLYVARAADITFKNINFYVVGQPVELGEWGFDGNGKCIKTSEFKDSIFFTMLEGDNSATTLPKKFTLECTDGSRGGKYSDSEESYYYYGINTPAGIDFKMDATLDIDSAPDDHKQAGFGISLFDEHYSRDTGDIPEGEDIPQAKVTNNIFLGLQSPSSSGDPYQFIARIRNGSKTPAITRTVILDTAFNDGANGPFDVSLIKSGDNLKVKVKAPNMDDYKTVDIGVEGILENNQYIAFSGARGGKMTVDLTKFEVGSKKVKSLAIEQMPDKVDYYTTTDKFDPTGLKLRATYVDDTEDIIDNPDDYALSGFDDSVARTFATAGQKTVTASIGKVSVEIPINVRARKITNINVDYPPIYDTYYAGGRFNTVGLQVTATYEDGNKEVLKASQYKLTIGGTEIKNGGMVSADMAGDDVAVTVQYTDATSDVVDPNGMTDAFNVKIQPGVLKGINILTYDFKDTYYVGEYIGRTPEDTVPAGLTIEGVFEGPDGKESTQFIPSDLWEVVGFDTSKPVTDEVLTIRMKDDPSIYTTYTIDVKEKFPVTKIFESYPRFTYSTDELFSMDGLDISVLYSDNSKLTLDADAYYYKTADGYFKEYRVDDTADPQAFVKGDVVEVSEAEALAADFYVDLTAYDSSAVGTTAVTIYVNEKYGGAAKTENFDVSIVDKKDYVWKAMIFGASSLGVKQTDEPSNMTVTYTDGTSEVSDATAHGIKPALMENGELSQVDNVRVRSWGGAGKISGDQDGIAYYYTTVDAKKNFSLTADIHVNNYIADPAHLSAEQQPLYNQYIVEEGGDPIKALDRMRSGQEAFGMMARDIIPYGGTIDKDGEYTGGPTNHMTPYPDEAPQKEYTFTRQNGETVTYKLPVDLYEAYRTGNYPAGYEITRGNVEAQITSNIIIAGGCTDSTYPTDPSSSSYYRKSVMNRINIMTRYGVTSTAGGGERVGIHSTTDHVPAAGDDYTVTFTKMNTGYYITTYDHTTGTTNTQYSFEDIDETEDALEIMDDENIYVGFFASRYADITVSNIKLNESLTATDPIITGDVDDTTKPNVTVLSPYYTTLKYYTLLLKSNCSSNKIGGITNIYMNGKTIRKDALLGSRQSSFDVELIPDYVNQFSVVYYPNTADDKFTSYDPVITRFTVTHKTLTDTSKLYVGPNGSIKGDATRENPITLEIAMAIVDFGGEVIMLDGTYHKNNRDVLDIEIPSTYSGLANGGYKTLRADEGAHPVIDLESQFAGFNVDADYWYFKGIEMKNSVDNEKAFGLGGNHVVVEDCVFHDNGTTGFQISRISGGDLISDWPSYNVVKSSESYNNMDSSKNNADGFAAKLTVGYGNVYEDCISHHNLDDGWDCYTKINSGAIGAVVLENCITYRQGYKLQDDGTDSDFNATSGGNGYKLGGEGIYVKHMLKDCIAFNCKANGIDTNNNPALKIRNVITYNNGGYNFALYSNTPNSLQKNGSTKDEEGRVYKFDYDMEGAVSAGNTVDRIGSLNEECGYGNISDKPILNEKNYLKVAPEGIFLDYSYKDDKGSDATAKVLDEKNYKDIASSNGYVKDENPGVAVGKDGKEHTYTNFVLAEGADVWDDATDFKSTDFLATAPGQRYQRNEDGSFNHGDFLARVEPYVHNAEDIVTLPDYLGGEGGVGLGETESTSSPVIEPPTAQPTTGGGGSSSGSGGGGGGGGGRGPASTATTQATTTAAEATTEAASEDTSDAVSGGTSSTAPALTVPVEVKIDSKDIKVNGKTYTMDVAPYIQTSSNSTMVPLRFVAIALAGGDMAKADDNSFISWDAATKTATINAGANKISFVAGSRVYTVNGNNYNIANQAVAEIVDGRMFVPFRTIGQALGVPVGWDANTKTASYNDAATK